MRPDEEPLALPSATPGEGEAKRPARANQRWLPIPGWPGYEAGARGRIRSRRGPLKATPDRDGYLYVELSDGGRRRRAHVAVLVLEAFAGPRPSPEHEALHGNGRRGDCRAANLRWGTRSENRADRERHRAERGAAERAASGVRDDKAGESGFETGTPQGYPVETGTGVSP